jgi:hypothetical protein
MTFVIPLSRLFYLLVGSFAILSNSYEITKGWHLICLMHPGHAHLICNDTLRAEARSFSGIHRRTKGRRFLAVCINRVTCGSRRATVLKEGEETIQLTS